MMQPMEVMSNELLAKRQFTGMILNGSADNLGQVPHETFSSAGIPTERNGFNGSNYTGYSNAAVDAALHGALTEHDAGKRQRLLDEVQAAIMSDLPLIPLFHGADILVSPKWMEGLTPARSVSHSTLWIEHWRPKAMREAQSIALPELA